MAPRACLTDCPTRREQGGFRFARVERAGDLPPADPRVVDVALLDMHHGWPNLGHEALADVIQSAVCDLREHLVRVGLSVRVISYDVRRGHALPEAPGGRHAIYVGTGGPGHLDPRAQRRPRGLPGHRREPGMGEAAVRAVRRDSRRPARVALRRLPHLRRDVPLAGRGRRRAARPPRRAARAPASGTISCARRHAGIRGSRALRRASATASASRCWTIVSSTCLPTGTVPAGRPACSPWTATRTARPATRSPWSKWRDDSRGAVPRILGVNHHPEIVNRQRQLALLEKKRARGGRQRGVVRRAVGGPHRARRRRRRRPGPAPYVELHVDGPAAGRALSRGAAQGRGARRRSRLPRAGVATGATAQSTRRCCPSELRPA